MRRARIQDVARVAGVSLSTVSAVLNGRNIVREQTKRRILEAISSLRYAPDHYASNLARRDTRVLGVIVSNLVNPFFAETAQAIEKQARKRGYQVALAATNFSPELLRSAVQQMLGARVSGLAVMTSEKDREAFAAITASGVPTVFLDVGNPGPHTMNLRVDSRRGMMEAVQHLIHLGHRDLLLVRNSQKQTGAPLLSHRYRDQGFAEAVKVCGIRGLHTHVVDIVGPGADAGQQAISQTYGAVPYTAVVAVTDMVALGVYRGLLERGASIPKDVSVIGFDNTYISRFMNPPLTTVDVPRAELSRITVEALTASESKVTWRRSRILRTSLILRASTAPPSS